jgi:glycine/D-amino acid oxidase-like deaminating enzyme
VKNDKVYEVAIIGGGVCGTAIAYDLAKAGVKVALLEKGDICSGTSGTNPGFCVLTYREDPVVMEMALEQRLEWIALSEELEIDLEYAETGGLIPFGNQRELEVLTGLADNCRKWGLKEVEIVKPERAVQQEIALDPAKIIGALYCPWEGKINPFKLTIGLADKARKLGADIFTRTKVTAMEVCGHEVKALETSQGRIKADLFVCAAGAWSSEVAAQAGVELPVKYERGEAMVSVPFPAVIRGMITDGKLFAKGENRPEMVVGACLAQTASGNIVMAQATTDVENYDCSSTYEGPKAVARRVLELFPKLSDLEILRMWGGAIAYTPDRAPLFGFLENRKNLLGVVGFHSAIGIAPILGKMVKEVYLKGSTGYDVAAYSPLRFKEQ